MRKLSEQFAEIADERHASYVKYRLADILTIIFCGVMCGVDSLEQLHIFAENYADYWKAQLGLETVPSRATLGRILCMTDGDAIGKVMVRLLRERFGADGEVVAVDGKAICSTGKEGQPHSSLQILTAYMTETGVVLGQEAIHEKTNEIPVFQQMLDYLYISDKVITADALHCQRDTCEKIIDKKGNYLFGLKKNQRSLYEDVELFCQQADADEFEICKTVEKNAGRLETRICKKMKDISWLLPRHNWPGLCSVITLERTVDVRGKKSCETSYYISSMNTSAERLMNIAREHWKIESMHWMLDVVFSEDDCYFLSENAHKTLNAMRKYALAAHKQFLASNQKKTPIKSSMLRCLLDINQLMKVLKIL